VSTVTARYVNYLISNFTGQ